jgi:hypothetical protein
MYASREIEVQAGRSGIPGAGTECGGMYTLSGEEVVQVETVTEAIRLFANPVAVKANHQVTFTATRFDGRSFSVYSWHWEPDAGQAGTASDPCWWLNPCQFSVQGSGTMTVHTSVGNGTAHVVVFASTFDLDADQTTVVAGDTVTFTPRLDGVAGPAARWKWISSDTTVRDATACGDGASPCRKAIVGSGTMWAYTDANPGQGDSAARAVTVVPARLTLACTPATVTREQQSHCMASESGGDVTIEEWRFVPDAPLDTIKEATTSNDWIGMVVTSGTVLVYGRIGGVRIESNAAHIAVNARTGFRIPIDTGAAADGDLSLQCEALPIWDITAQIGWARKPGHCTGTIPLEPEPASGSVAVVTTIGAGPNQGLSYTHSLSTRAVKYTQLHRDLRSDANLYPLSSQSVLGLKCLSPLIDTTVQRTLIQADSACAHRTGATDMRDYVQRHEACHSYLMAISINNDPVNIARVDSIEALVSLSAADNVQDIRDWLNAVSLDAYIASKSIDAPPAVNFDAWSATSLAGDWTILTFPLGAQLAPGC